MRRASWRCPPCLHSPQLGNGFDSARREQVAVHRILARGDSLAGAPLAHRSGSLGQHFSGGLVASEGAAEIFHTCNCGRIHSAEIDELSQFGNRHNINGL